MFGELFKVDYHWGRIRLVLFLFALTILLVRCFYNEELQPSQINHSEELTDLEIFDEGHRRIPEGFFEFQEPVTMIW